MLGGGMSLIEKAIVLVVLFLLMLAGAYFLEHYIEQIGYARAVDDYAKQAEKVDAKREAVAPIIETRYLKAAERIVVVTETITKEIPTYVKDSDCPMPPGFRVLHDAAANGEVPNPVAIPDATAVPAQTVASTVAANYGEALLNAKRLTELQAWVTAQQKLTTK